PPRAPPAPRTPAPAAPRPGPGACARWARDRGAACRCVRTCRACSWADQPDVGGFRLDHAELAARDRFDARRVGPGGLLQFQATELDVEVVALVLQFRQLHEQHAV